tara:strand:+ start:161 stop:457 length:297 start_codon:yes stop_codon:yes gene_type:complete
MPSIRDITRRLYGYSYAGPGFVDFMEKECAKERVMEVLGNHYRIGDSTLGDLLLISAIGDIDSGIVEPGQVVREIEFHVRNEKHGDFAKRVGVKLNEC